MYGKDASLFAHKEPRSDISCWSHNERAWKFGRATYRSETHDNFWLTNVVLIYSRKNLQAEAHVYIPAFF